MQTHLLPGGALKRIDSPLGCGARLWIETTAAVQLHIAPAQAGE